MKKKSVFALWLLFFFLSTKKENPSFGSVFFFCSEYEDNAHDSNVTSDNRNFSTSFFFYFFALRHFFFSVIENSGTNVIMCERKKGCE